VLEQGKNWREADADVAEAIDFLRYYAQQAAALAGWRPTLSFPGEENLARFEPRGVAAIIAPWNFPLAILTGMTSAALVTGNCALMKPAGPANIVAHKLHSILLEAGFPPPVCQLLPGRGGVVGEFLVQHPHVQLIAFTGSREVGLALLEQAGRLAPGQSHLKQVVCEMGGKNAIIVDEDADLDEAVTHVLHSAFGYQGQKCSACSRLVAVGRVHDRLVERLAQALDAHPYGPPEDPRHVFGPVITGDARDKALRYIEIGKREGRLYYQGKVPQEGYYVPPSIFTGIGPRDRLAREEIFAPVLAVLRAESFEQALEIALDSDYALTGGVFSRLPRHLAAARERFRVGDLYLNRRITGALVAAQPFGGVGLSGTGVQAGGPDYLKQFVWSRVVSENVMRHGFVPPAGIS
ncbi:MAG: aldehyde dehydrogenase family protein, partial [Burkholderiales bacterium]